MEGKEFTTRGASGDPGAGGRSTRPAGGMGGRASGSPDAARARRQGPAGFGHALGGAQDRINQGMREAADRIESVAHRLDDLIEQRLPGATGRMAQAGEAGRSLADTLETVAGYLRSSDVETVRHEVESRVRERPVQSILIAVAAGWLAGKILR